MRPSECRPVAQLILDEVERRVVGRRGALLDVLTALVARGHVLVEDLPGTGKTLIAKSFAAALGLDFRRVQFTPDLLPADLTGSFVFDPRTREFDFRPGPVFTNLLLADEINRTPPKTQAALLEAMEERQVSTDGQTRGLPAPFFVIATDNPIEYEGTYELPEAQLDRFAVRLSLGLPELADELTMLQRRLSSGEHSAVPITPAVDAATLVAMQQSVEDVHVDGDIAAYLLDVVRATRGHPAVEAGASPRAAVVLLQLTRARAALCGRDFVIVDDVQHQARLALPHRLVIRPELWVRRVSGADIVDELLSSLPVPTTAIPPTTATPPTTGTPPATATPPAGTRQVGDAGPDVDPGPGSHGGSGRHAEWDDPARVREP